MHESAQHSSFTFLGHNLDYQAWSGCEDISSSLVGLVVRAELSISESVTEG